MVPFVIFSMNALLELLEEDLLDMDGRVVNDSGTIDGPEWKFTAQNTDGKIFFGEIGNHSIIERAVSVLL